MRARTAWIVAAVLFATFPASTADASPATDHAERVRYANETINLSYDDYVARQEDFRANGCKYDPPNAHYGCNKPAPYNGFDWTDDGCSGRDVFGPVSNVWRNLFNKPCRQHDFGYRNFGKGLTLERTEAKRAAIDARFRVEMNKLCNATFTRWWQAANRELCLREATAVWAAVRYNPRENWNSPLSSDKCCTPPWTPPSAPPAPTPPQAPAPPTTPAPVQAVVRLDRGPAAPAGYRYAVTLSGFPAGATVNVTCHDSVSPGGFYSFSMATDGAGAASTARQCYSGDHPDHWVRANGIESNHVTW